MACILALDIGENTIGVAMSDETETLAFPGETIIRHEGYKRDMAVLRQMVLEREVAEVVVGMPLMMDGTRAVQAGKIEAFVVDLQRYVHVPIMEQDERLSTSEADRLLIQANRNREERKKVVDSVAASLILQSYLDKKRALKA